MLTEAVSDKEFANNSEIYLASLAARAPFSNDLQILHGASFGKEPAALKAIAPGQIAVARGVNLALYAVRSRPSVGGVFPHTLGGASLTVNGRLAQIFYASPTQINFQVPAQTETGTAQVLVRNHDGRESRASVVVLPAAPGVFTESGDGSGASIALDAQTLLRGPFDPDDATNSPRRLIIFSTGVRFAQSVGVTIGGRVLAVENVLPSPDLPGLDQIHVLLTRALAGVGNVPLIVSADGRESNPANINFTGTRRPASITLEPAAASVGVGRSLHFAALVRDADGVEITNAPITYNSSDESTANINAAGVAQGVRVGMVTITATSGEVSASARLTIFPLTFVLNEILADPPDGAAGDANHDGVRSSAQDEFVELVNASAFDLNIGGYRLTTRNGRGGADTVRHTFAVDTIIAPGAAVVVFGGAQANSFDTTHPAFAGALVLTASTGGLSLTNGGSVVKLLDPSGATVEELAYGGASEPEGDRNQSLTRAPDITGDFITHETAALSGGRSFSPGTRIDATPFLITVPIVRIEVAPLAASVERGAQQQFTARAFDTNEIELQGVVFRWRSADMTVATIDGNGLAQSLAVGETQITATARGIQSTHATLNVLAPQPEIARVEVVPLTASVNRGGTLQFSAQAFDPQGRPVSDANFLWSSGNTSIASIDSAGLARGSGVGVAKIEASTSDGVGGAVTGQASVEVLVPIVLNEIFADVPPDDPATRAVEGDASRDGVRSADDDEFVEILNYSTSPVDISGIVVTDAAARRFTFPAGTILAAGGPLLVFGGGAPPRVDPAFGGSSIFNAASLSLNDAGDTVLLKLPVGDVEITIASQSYGTATASAPHAPVDQSSTRSPDAASGSTGGDFIAHTLVTNAATRPYSPGTRADGTPFNSPHITRIYVDPATAAIEIGAPQNFRAQAYAMLDGVERGVSNVSFFWDSSDAGVAAIAPTSGMETTARAASAGKTLIRARAGGLETIATLTVNPPPPVLARLILSPDAATINVGGAEQFTAQAFDQYDQPFPVSSINFNSDAAAVATIESVNQSPASGAARATVKGRAEGLAHITASAEGGGRSVASNVATLKVNPPPPSIARIEIAPQSATIGVGATQQFTARAYDQNNREMHGVTFNWRTSDRGVADIDAGGLATGRSAGATGVTAASANVESAPASLTVTAPPLPSAGQVVINEALVAFATSGTQARRDFVELYNTTGQTLDITGLVLTFRPSGSGNTPRSLTLGDGAAGDKFLIQPHGYFLIAGGADTFGVRVDFNTGGSDFDLNNTTGGIKIEIGGVKLDGLAYQGSATAPSATFSAYGEGALFRFTGGTTNDLIRSPNAADTNNNATDFRRNGTTSSVSPKAANP